MIIKRITNSRDWFECRIQTALVICGLFICDFACMRSRNGLFSRTYPLIYSHPWSFYMQILLYASLFFGSLSLAYNKVYLYLLMLNKDSTEHVSTWECACNSGRGVPKSRLRATEFRCYVMYLSGNSACCVLSIHIKISVCVLVREHIHYNTHTFNKVVVLL